MVFFALVVSMQQVRCGDAEPAAENSSGGANAGGVPTGGTVSGGSEGGNVRESGGNGTGASEAGSSGRSTDEGGGAGEGGSGGGNAGAGGSSPEGGASGQAGGAGELVSGGGSVSTGGKATAGTGGIDLSIGGNAGNCGSPTFTLNAEPAEVLLVLDRSASMTDAPDGQLDGSSKWSLVVPALSEVISATDTSIAWGMKSFPEGEGNECAPGSVSEKVDVEIARANASIVNSAIATLTPTGNGTPTGDAVKHALAYLKTLSSTRPKFLLLATDGEPSCAGTIKGATEALPYAVQAISDALTAGVPTYVVGVATTKNSATAALNAMAVAGGKARSSTNPLVPRYYLANTNAELVSSLRSVTQDVGRGCVFVLDPPPPAPDFVAVKLAGASVSRDPARRAGWEYASADFTLLEVFGAACDTIKNNQTSKIEIIYGCLSG